MFPGVTGTRLWTKPLAVTAALCVWNSPIAGSITLATLCSEAASVKATKHHQTITSLPDSLPARIALYRARITSQLGSTPCRGRVSDARRDLSSRSWVSLIPSPGTGEG